MNCKTVQAFLKKNANWSLSRNGKVICRKYRFKDFAEALTFIQLVGDSAQKVGHHPDITLKKYRFITLHLTTHACHGLSRLDLRLAGTIEKIYCGLI